MKKIYFLLAILWAYTPLLAQIEPPTAAILSFQEKYNEEKYDQIFGSFSPEMKVALPLENTLHYLKELKSQVGKFESSEFINFQQGTYASYKTRFERAILTVNISLDDQNKINGFFVKPYEEPQPIENSLGDYPKEIGELIFSKAKDLPNRASLSIAVITYGEIKNYGVLKLDNSILPSKNHNSLYEIGSISKVFTSTVLASLVVAKELKLIDEINPYFDFKFKNDLRITFESLANHTSGLPRLPENLDLSNESNPYKSYGKKELEDYLRDIMELKSTPSPTYLYSNLGAGLLGYTLGLTQKASFQEVLKTKIFDTYGMIHSYTSAQNLNPNLVKGLDNQGNAAANWDFDALFGGGGIVSSTEDVAKFLLAHFNPSDSVLALTRQPTFTISGNSAMGLGWHRMKLQNKKEVFWHNGGTGGYSSCLVLDVENQTAVIVLSNVSGINKTTDALCFALFDTLQKGIASN